MAFSAYTQWLAVYRTPADDYKYLHINCLSGPRDFALMKRDFYERHANVDARLEKLEPVDSPVEVAAAAARILRDSGGDYRPLAGDEHKLTKADVAELRAEMGNLGPGGAINDSDLRYVPTVAEVKKIVATDASGNIVS